MSEFDKLVGECVRAWHLLDDMGEDPITDKMIQRILRLRKVYYGSFFYDAMNLAHHFISLEGV